MSTTPAASASAAANAPVPTAAGAVTPASATAARAPGRPGGDRFRCGAARWIVLALVGAAALLMIAPFLLMVMNAFKSPEDYSAGSPLSWPRELYTEDLVYF